MLLIYIFNLKITCDTLRLLGRTSSNNVHGDDRENDQHASARTARDLEEEQGELHGCLDGYAFQAHENPYFVEIRNVYGGFFENYQE